MQLGDARTGKWPINLLGFARALRRSGVPMDSAKIALSLQAAMAVGLENKADLQTALSCVLISRLEDRAVFQELFDAYFKDPKVANQLLAQMLPSTEGQAQANKRKPRVNEALNPKRGQASHQDPKKDTEFEWDAAMTASDLARLRQSDFGALGAEEFKLVQRLALQIPMVLPTCITRRQTASKRGLNWPRAFRQALQTEGEMLHLPKRGPRRRPLPLMIIVDISGSMERYARLLLAFLHQATRSYPEREVMVFGTELTRLSAVFQCADPDEMLQGVNETVRDFAAGTLLGRSLHQLQVRHPRTLVAKRSVVLLITDGLDTGESQELEAALQWLKRHCKTLCWLNPLLRFEGYEPLAKGASLLDRYADAKIAIHNLSHLEQLARALARVVSAKRE
jgi:uncharacterized protein with von Willebrand factor type A (vWA) domain